METKNTGKRLSEYNAIFKENNELYHGIAKVLGLPDCAFWILYVLRESDKPVTQSAVSNMIYQTKQTVNSALKKMEADGYIEMVEMRDRRSKQICLTEKGVALAERTVDQVIAYEHDAMAEMSVEEQESLIRLLRKYTDLLNKHMKELYKKQEET